jgi:hypothetical protein
MGMLAWMGKRRSGGGQIDHFVTKKRKDLELKLTWSSDVENHGHSSWRDIVQLLAS